MSVLVDVQNLTKAYSHDGLKEMPLKSVSIQVKTGEFLVLMGPSGSGKTTLLNIIGGIDKPTEGTISIDGIEITRLNQSALAKWRRKNIGYIFQLFNLIPVLTAFENVELPLLLLPLSHSERRCKAVEVLASVGLKNRESYYPRQLSGGQQQRVAIARALVTDPKIILADEPTGNLDADSQEEVLNLMQGLNRDLDQTFIMVTHDPRAADKGTRVLRLDKGIIGEGDINEICPSHR